MDCRDDEVPLVCEVQLVPPSVVFSIVPEAPIAKPVLASTIWMDCRCSEVPLVSEVQFTPPSVVVIIVPAFP